MDICFIVLFVLNSPKENKGNISRLGHTQYYSPIRASSLWYSFSIFAWFKFCKSYISFNKELLFSLHVNVWLCNVSIFFQLQYILSFLINLSRCWLSCLALFGRLPPLTPTFIFHVYVPDAGYSRNTCEY